MRVGFVNNMPDGAFEETEQQFARLVGSGGDDPAVSLVGYLMPGIQRSPAVRSALMPRYRPLQTLYEDPPDALIVTGTEPRCPDLRAEPYWAELQRLLAWAEGTVPVTLLSCLASHGALLSLDGVERRRLRRKLSGVFPQSLHPTHPLAEGLGTVAFPHSRLNDVPAEHLLRTGYVVVAAGLGTGWTVAARERDGRLLVLLQGHPEYSGATLLREHRRDIRRFAEGRARHYPRIPEGYLDPEGVSLLEQFRRGGQRSGRLQMALFPFEAAAAHIAVDWQDASATLVGNWLAQAAARSGSAAVSR